LVNYRNAATNIGTNNTVVMTITGSNVGIGTTSPAALLHVNGTVSASNLYINSSNGVYFSGDGSGTVANGAGYFYVNTTGGAYFQNTVRFRGAIQNDTATYLRIDGGSSNHTYINGRLGIANTSPSYPLDITGDTRVNTGALGVNVTPNAQDGRIDASNDIVAYSSDRRLKTNIQILENPLEKINKLTGFTYNWNDEAKELANYNTEEKLVGVFAQEVQEILPEAVKLAPFDNDGNDNSISGENYLTVQYEKIVPLLIEAIKEQQKQIDELKYLLQNKT
jgi:hypothetical protein